MSSICATCHSTRRFSESFVKDSSASKVDPFFFAHETLLAMSHEESPGNLRPFGRFRFCHTDLHTQPTPHSFRTSCLFAAMDDFDDQLLALAGDESDSDQENGSGAGPSRSPSPAPAAAARSPSPQQSLPDTSTEAKSSKTAARRGATMAKRRKADESEEEGEA